jgi:hypothetical protein
MFSRQSVLIVVLVVLVAAAAAFQFWLRADDTKTLKRFDLSGVCLNCKHEVSTGTYDAFHPAPWVCPSCGKQAVYTWFYCEDCDYRFVPVPQPGLQQRPDGPDVYPPPMIAHCPVCEGGGHPSPWYPTFVPESGHQEKGKRDLPPWPGAAGSH